MIDQLNQTIVQKDGTITDREATIQGMHDRVRDAELRSEESLKEHQRRTGEIEEQYRAKEKLMQDSLRK